MRQIQPTDTNGNVINYLVQWDENITICLTDDLITAAYYVHFQVGSSDEAYSVSSEYSDNTLTVVIPADLLTVAKPLTGYVYLEEDDTKQSILFFRIGIIPRGEPA